MLLFLSLFCFYTHLFVCLFVCLLGGGLVGGRWWVCIITFMAYAAYHVARKSFSVIKGVIIEEEFFSSPLYSRDDQSTMCGLLDTIFLAFYATGLYISGVLGDIYNPRIVLTVGMFAMAMYASTCGVRLAVFCFPLVGKPHV
jgi:sugar phosphate permease